MTLEGDSKTNKLKDSTEKFSKLSSYSWCQNKPIVLFLNKKDIFMEKIETHPLEQYFEEYQPFVDQLPTEKYISKYDKACHFFRDYFLKAYLGRAGLFITFTNATKADTIERVYDFRIFHNF